MKQILLTIYLILFTLPSWGQTKPPSLPESVISNFSPNHKIITSLDDREYPFCSTETLDWTGRDINKIDKFFQDNSQYFNSDYVSVFKNTESSKLVDGKQIYTSFEDGLIKYTFALQGQHHNCLFKQSNSSCQKLIDITSQLSKKKAATSPSSPIKNTEIPFVTIQKLLIPTIIGYSSAIQVLGKPENHNEIGKWFEAAFNANVLNSETGEGIDLFRASQDFKPERKKFGCFNAAQNHSLQSGFLYMAYSAVWGDLDKLAIGLDQLKLTLKSVKKDGALPCEVTRGPNSLFYSGATIHTMLQMLQILDLQNINYNDILDLKSLHKAVSFQIDAGVNPEIMNKYTKSFSENTWCKPYKKNSGQCIYQRPMRNVSFGWIQLYIKLFPTHKNTNRLDLMFKNFQKEEIKNPVKKLNLNAIFQPNQTKSSLKLNYVDIIEDWEKQGDAEDKYMSHFNDSSDWARGSPLCLYVNGIVKKVQRTNLFDGQYKFNLFRSSDQESMKIGSGYITINDGEIIINNQERFLKTGSENLYDSLDAQVDENGIVSGFIEMDILSRSERTEFYDFDGEISKKIWGTSPEEGEFKIYIKFE